MAIRIILVLIVVLCLAGILIANYTIEKETLPPEEAEQIMDACGSCHRNPDRLSIDNIHQKHQGVDCTTCHINNLDLESAKKTHDIIFWIATGIASFTMASLAINYAVARKRLSSRNEVNKDENN